MHKQGDIVLIPVPFSDLSNRKQRPVLVISNVDYNQMTDDILVVAITSQLKDLDYSVVIEQKDLDEGTLKVTSAVRADKVYTRVLMLNNLVLKPPQFMQFFIH